MDTNTIKIAVQLAADTAIRGAQQLSTSIKQIGTSAQTASNQFGQSMSQLASQAKQHLGVVKQAFSQFGQSMGAANQQMGNLGKSIGLSAALYSTLITTISRAGREMYQFAVDRTLELDKTRNALIGLTGSVQGATAKFNELYKLSQQATGVTLGMATEIYSSWKAIGTVSDQSINKLIQGMGKLNAAFTIQDPKSFALNLQQIFTLGFQQVDIKQAVRQVPIFRTLLQEAFGTSDGSKLRELKAAGKITADSYVQALADAISNNRILQGIPESIAVQFEKIKDRIAVALEPGVRAMFDKLLPALEQITGATDGLSSAFIALGGGLGGITSGILGALSGVFQLVGALDTALGKLMKLAGFREDSGAAAIGGAYGDVGGVFNAAVGDILNNPWKPIAGEGTELNKLFNSWVKRENDANTKERMAIIQGQMDTAVKDRRVLKPGDKFESTGLGATGGYVTNQVTAAQAATMKGMRTADAKGNQYIGTGTRTVLIPKANIGGDISGDMINQWEVQANVADLQTKSGGPRDKSREQQQRESLIYQIEDLYRAHNDILPPPMLSGRNARELTNILDTYRDMVKDDNKPDRAASMKGMESTIKRYGGVSLTEAQLQDQRTTDALPGSMTESQARDTRFRVQTGRYDYENALNRIDGMVQGGQLAPGDADQLRAAAARQYGQEVRSVIRDLDVAGKLHKDEELQLTETAEAYERLYEQTQKLGSNGAAFMRGFNSEIKTMRQMMEELGSSIANAFNDLNSVFDNLGSTLKRFMNNLAGNVIQRGLAPLLGQLTGVAQAASGGGASASSGTAATAGRILQPGDSGYSVFSDPYVIAGNGVLGGMGMGLNMSPQDQQEIFREATTASKPNPVNTNSVSFLGNIKNMFNWGTDASGNALKAGATNWGKVLGAGALGASVAGSLGLGGQSMAGNILGQAGGAIGSIAIGSAVSGVGLFGLSALATTGIGAAIAAPLIIGSILLGKAKQRKADESVVDTYWVEYGNVLNQLTAGVNSDKIMGDDALAQGAEARQTAVDLISQIKTKSVRDSRLKNQIPQVDATNLKALQEAVATQRTRLADQETTMNNRRDLDSRLVAEFAVGGVVPGPFGARTNIIAHAGEVVLNQQQIQEIGQGTLSDAGVPGMRGGNGGGSGQGPVEVTFVMGTDTADQVFVSGMQSKNTRGATASTVSRIMRYGG